MTRLGFGEEVAGMDVLLLGKAREMKPLLLRAGLALALSLAGYFFSRSGAASGEGRRVQQQQRPPLPPPAEADGCNQGGHELQEDCRLMKNEGEVPVRPVSDHAPSPVVASLMSSNAGDAAGYLLPGFDELVLGEFEASVKEVLKGADKPRMPVSLRKGKDVLFVIDEEIAGMKSRVQSLQERERELELQLLAYHGLKEQKATVSELENRLRFNSMEARALSMKIQSLQEENRRLEAQLSLYSGVAAELDDTRERIKLLECKMSCSSEQAGEMVAALHEKLAALLASETERRARDGEHEYVFRRLKDLEEEASILRNENSKLAVKNLDLVKKLESVSMFCQLRSEDDTKVLNEANHLRERNEELLKEIEQLQIDMSADVEELVYLKWLNACLRYEMRGCEHPEGKTVASDLSNTSSPRSEEKAKQLIHEYGNSGRNESSGITDLNSESSTSGSSSLTFSRDLDNPSISTKNRNSSGKTKFFGKLKKLVMGKDQHGNKSSRSDRDRRGLVSSERRASMSNYSSDDMFSRHSFDSSISCISMEHNPTNPLAPFGSKAEKHSLEEAQVVKDQRSQSDLGYSIARKLSVLGTGRSDSHHSIDMDGKSVDYFAETEELKKLANALMGTSKSPQFRRPGS